MIGACCIPFIQIVHRTVCIPFLRSFDLVHGVYCVQHASYFFFDFCGLLFWLTYLTWNMLIIIVAKINYFLFHICYFLFGWWLRHLWHLWHLLLFCFFFSVCYCCIYVLLFCLFLYHFNFWYYLLSFFFINGTLPGGSYNGFSLS
jgi:hypothetical protein